MAEARLHQEASTPFRLNLRNDIRIVSIADDVVMGFGLTLKKIMLGGWLCFLCLSFSSYNADVIADLGGACE